ncbi:RHS repeat-associated core domain-containing protein [Pseudomonas sp. S37]|uniref:RHS repeat-associated core domain-containing protein n=1 Tax=Pseudomonas sp. S37 TaxID=2767449 RepID=UPI0019124FA2|nr:RHS repeat-associated core domain-containing protein [Pseudomonas sp. S37]MBK4995040.1 RHS repeat-associated core domain-containing protein [Pseudomonas sp. S37]
MPQNSKQRLFYKNGHLSSAIGSDQSVTVFSNLSTPFAERRTNEHSIETPLLITDAQLSILNSTYHGHTINLIYTAYGQTSRLHATDVFLAFTGQRHDRLTHCYFLGNGYRTYSPALMRFHSPDSESPFGRGGHNTYAYCSGDPLNYHDPSGHSPIAWLKSLFKGKSVMQRRDLALAAIEKNPKLEKYRTIANQSTNPEELKYISDTGKALGVLKSSLNKGEIYIDSRGNLAYDRIIDPFERESRQSLEGIVAENEKNLQSILPSYPAVQEPLPSTSFTSHSSSSPTAANKLIRT